MQLWWEHILQIPNIWVLCLEHKQNISFEITKAEDTQLWHLLCSPENVVHAVELEIQHLNVHYKHRHISPHPEDWEYVNMLVKYKTNNIILINLIQIQSIVIYPLNCNPKLLSKRYHKNNDLETAF